MVQRVLVTGASGFAGRYMCHYLTSLDPRPGIVGLDLQAADSLPVDVFFEEDLTDFPSVMRVLESERPDCILHLAGTFGSTEALDVYQTNAMGTASLLEAAARTGKKPLTIVTGSAAEYGIVTGSALPVQETAPLRPITPYGLSKKLATEIALYYHEVGLLPVVVVRPFQLIGPGVTHRLAPGAFRDRLHEALRSGSGVIKVGNLDSKRDFLDVRDAVDGIWKLCLNPAPGQVFNLCSGRATRIGDLLEAMIEQLAADVRIDTDPALLRHGQEVPVIYGSIDKIHACCGFTPKHSLRDSITQMLAEDPPQM